MVASATRKLATAALAALILLIFAGAVVRVTGAGLGCPDWPTCWGCLVPPWKKEQIDPAKLDFEKFRRKAERLGRDPATITPGRILDSFDPVLTWTEYLNRLLAVPLGVLCVATVVVAARDRRRRPAAFVAAAVALVLVLFNGWLGANVVFSGLRPGIITTHLAAAIALMLVLVFTAWAGGPRWAIPLAGPAARPARVAMAVLLAATITEGILGAKVREITDQLQLHHLDTPRAEWIAELEQATVYLVHRSFSWAILAAAIAQFVFARRADPAGRGDPLARTVLALVLVQMLFGAVLSQRGIHPVVQVLHVGCAAILVCAGFLWLLAARPQHQDPEITPRDPR